MSTPQLPRRTVLTCVTTLVIVSQLAQSSLSAFATPDRRESPSIRPAAPATVTSLAPQALATRTRFAIPVAPAIALDSAMPPGADLGNTAREAAPHLEFPSGNNNYGQTQRDTDNPEAHPGRHFVGSVNATNGNLFLQTGDVYVPGIGLSLQFARYYNSVAAATGEGGSLGPGWTHSYGTRVISATGSATLRVVDADGALHDYHTPQPCADAPTAVCYQSPPGLYRQLRRSLSGSYLLFHKNGTRQVYDASGRLASIFDHDGNAIQMQYGFCSPNPDDLCLVIDSTGHRVLQLNYESGPSGVRLASLVEGFAGGRTVVYGYDPLGRLSVVAYPEGSQATYQYDPLNRLIAYSDPRQPPGVGKADQIDYDPQGRAVTVTVDSFFDVFYRLQYDLPPQVEVSRAARATRSTDGAGRQSIVELDENDNVVFEGDFVTARGWWIGKRWWWWPGRWWLPWRMLDANNNPTAYDYDAWGNTTVVTNAAGSVQRFHWEPPAYSPPTLSTAGKVLSATNGAGVTTLYTYDPAGKIVTHTQATGTPQQTVDVYRSTARGQLIEQVDGGERVTTYGYDALGNTVAITDPRGSVTRYAYDMIGRPVSSTDPGGGVTTYAYDPADRLLSVTDPAGGTTRYAYGPGGRDNVVQLVNANGVTITYGYDSLDRLTHQTDSLGATTVYTYDAASRLVARADADGRVTQYAYDEKNRMTSMAYLNSPADPAPTQTHLYQYDDAGNLIGMANPDVQLAYQYDSLNQRTRVDLRAPGWPATRTLQLERDDVSGLLTRASVAGAYDARYGYDSLNRLIRLVRSSSAPYTVTFQYDPAGRLKHAAYPGGMQSDYAYDKTNHLTQVSHLLAGGETLSYDYNYDARGNLVREVDEGVVYTYTYDAAGRVTSATDASRGALAYEYDAAGNRTATRGGDQAVTTFTYDAHSRLLQAGEATLAYNRMGARITAQPAPGRTLHYAYDNDMRLTQVNDSASGATTFLYDPLGNLIGAVSAGGAARYFLRDGQDVFAELDAAGNVAATYAIADAPIGIERGGQRYLLLRDGSGRARRVVDLDSQASVASYGADLNDPGSNPAFDNPLRLSNGWWFAEVGLLHFGDGVFWDPWFGVLLNKCWTWLYWPFGPFHPWRPVFRFWPWPWPWPRPWGWPWPHPWPFLWPWPRLWIFPWVIWPFWPWAFTPWWPWWYWRWWWGWTWWGHWWCWHPWWWFGKWWWWPWWHPWWWGYWCWPWWWWSQCWWWPHWWWHWVWWWPRWWRWRWWWPWWRPWPYWWGYAIPPELGDAPDPPYSSRVTHASALHRVWWHEWLGASRNGEWDSRQVNADPFDDGVFIDLAAGAVVFTPTVASPLGGRYGSLTPLHVHGWLDWNNDGDWDDPGEFVVNWSGYPGAGGWPALANSIRVTRAVTIPPSIPTGGVYAVWARLRLDYAQNVESPRGPARFGEVEDYVTRVLRPTPPPWSGGVVTPSAGLMITFTQVVTGVSVGITPALLITPVWRIRPLAQRLRGSAIAANADFGDELEIRHAPFMPGQTYTISLDGGSAIDDPELPLLPVAFPVTIAAEMRQVIFMPLVRRSN